MAGSRPTASPLRSFIDLACGAFGAVMLLAMALIKVQPPMEEPGWPSGSVAITLPFAFVEEDTMFDAFYKTSIRVAGRSLAQPSGLDTSRDEARQVQWFSGIDTSGRWRLDMRVIELREPVEVEVEIVAPPDAYRTWPRTMRAHVGGSAVHPAVVEQLAEQPQQQLPEAEVLGIRLRLDPDLSDAGQVVAVEAR